MRADPQKENKARHQEVELTTQRGSWRGPYRQQRCQPERGAGAVRAGQAAYRAETFDHEPSRG